jgi:hypothetical protein
MPATVQGELADQAREGLQAELEAGLGRASVELIGSEATAQASGGASCEDPACVTRVAAAASATHVVGLSIAIDGRSYEVTMTLYDGSDGSTIAVSRDACEVCGLSEVQELIAGQAAVLVNKLDSIDAPTTIAVETDPAGATVRIDGRVVGKSPYEDAALPGEHVIQVERDGYVLRERIVNTVAQTQEVVTFELKPIPTEGPNDKTLRRQRIAGWTVLGAGIGVFAGGVALFSLNERDVGSRCSGDAIGPTGLCRWKFKTLPYALPLTIIGTAAIAAGVALVVKAGRKHKSAGRQGERARVSPGLGGVRVEF